MAVEQAALTAPAELQARAEAGDPVSQLAWSVVLTHGLNGTAMDIDAAGSWRARAMAASGTRQATFYQSAAGSGAGRVTSVPVTVGALSIDDVRFARRCAAALAADAVSAPSGSCGAAPVAARLKSAWAMKSPQP